MSTQQTVSYTQQLATSPSTPNTLLHNPTHNTIQHTCTPFQHLTHHHTTLRTTPTPHRPPHNHTTLHTTPSKHTHTHAYTRTHTHTHAHARTRARTHHNRPRGGKVPDRQKQELRAENLRFPVKGQAGVGVLLLMCSWCAADVLLHGAGQS